VEVHPQYLRAHLESVLRHVKQALQDIRAMCLEVAHARARSAGDQATARTFEREDTKDLHPEFVCVYGPLHWSINQMLLVGSQASPMYRVFIQEFARMALSWHQTKDGGSFALGKCYDTNKRVVRGMLFALLLGFRLIYAREHPGTPECTYAELAVYSMREGCGTDYFRRALAQYAFVDAPQHIVFADVCVRYNDYALKVSMDKIFFMACISPSKTWDKPSQVGDDTCIADEDIEGQVGGEQSVQLEEGEEGEEEVVIVDALLLPDKEGRSGKPAPVRLQKGNYSNLLVSALHDHAVGSDAEREESRVNFGLRTEQAGEYKSPDGAHEHINKIMSEQTPSMGMNTTYVQKKMGPASKFREDQREDLESYTKDPTKTVSRADPEFDKMEDILEMTHILCGWNAFDDVADRDLYTPFEKDARTKKPHVVPYSPEDYSMVAGMKVLPGFLAKRYTENELRLPDTAATRAPVDTEMNTHSNTDIHMDTEPRTTQDPAPDETMESTNGEVATCSSQDHITAFLEIVNDHRTCNGAELCEREDLLLFKGLTSEEALAALRKGGGKYKPTALTMQDRPHKVIEEALKRYKKVLAQPPTKTGQQPGRTRKEQEQQQQEAWTARVEAFFAQLSLPERMPHMHPLTPPSARNPAVPEQDTTPSSSTAVSPPIGPKQENRAKAQERGRGAHQVYETTQPPNSADRVNKLATLQRRPKSGDGNNLSRKKRRERLLSQP